jgi:tripartite-type tricarboxylate transporter receptor subunit TctC
MSEITRRTTVGMLASLVATPVLAQAPPGQNLTVVVPFPPGGSTDAMARLLQPGLQQRFATNVIIENKPGGAGSIGASQVARSTPNGSTLLLTFDSHAVIPALIKAPSVDVRRDLLPVLLVGTAPYVVATSTARPYKSFSDVVTAAKAKPGLVNFASVGLGTIGHLAMTLLAKASDCEITHVPYKGGGPAVNDVVGGHVELIAGSAALLMPHITAGTMRPLMQLGLKRLDSLPNVPTAAESGFKDFEAVAWWGVFAPTGTPPAVIATAVEHFKGSLSDEAVSKRLKETQQVTLLLQGPAEFAKFFAREVDIWGRVVTDNKIEAN